MNRINLSLGASLGVVFVVFALGIFGGARSAFAMGSDHRKEAVSFDSWPAGMSNLVNSKERIHGYFVNARDIFFFVGDQERFDQFLRDYAKMDGLVSHKVVIHSGIGRAKSPWQKDEGLKCDWMIDGCPSSWLRGDRNAKGYVLEVHIWEDGRIKLDMAHLPEGVTVEKAKNAEPDRSTNGSQPIRTETNRTTSAEGSHR